MLKNGKFTDKTDLVYFGARPTLAGSRPGSAGTRSVCVWLAECFNHKTNVDIHNRLVAFDIKELGKQLKKLGMLIIQDQIWGRVTQNRSQGRATWYFADEFHLLLKEEQTDRKSVV